MLSEQGGIRLDDMLRRWEILCVSRL